MSSITNEVYLYMLKIRKYKWISKSNFFFLKTSMWMRSQLSLLGTHIIWNGIDINEWLKVFIMNLEKNFSILVPEK